MSRIGACFEHRHVLLTARRDSRDVRDREKLLAPLHRTFVYLPKQVLRATHNPMRRNLPQPRHTRLLHRHTRIEPTRHRVVNDRLLLLVQQRNQLPLHPNEALDAAVRVIEEADDGGLFVGTRKCERDLAHASDRKVPLTNSNAIGRLSKMCNAGSAPKEHRTESPIRDVEVIDEVRRAHDAIAWGDSHRSLPGLHLVDHEASSSCDFVVREVVGDDIVIVISGGSHEHALLPRDREQGQIRAIAFVAWNDQRPK